MLRKKVWSHLRKQETFRHLGLMELNNDVFSEQSDGVGYGDKALGGVKEYVCGKLGNGEHNHVPDSKQFQN